MIRMLLVGYLNGLCSERKLRAEVHLNLGYRWFCHLGLDGAVPKHSTFSKDRRSRFFYGIINYRTERERERLRIKEDNPVCYYLTLY